MVALKGKPDIGDQINKKIIAPLANANKLSDFPDFNDAAMYRLNCMDATKAKEIVVSAHEASHAVASVRLGLPFEYVTLDDAAIGPLMMRRSVHTFSMSKICHVQSCSIVVAAAAAIRTGPCARHVVQRKSAPSLTL